MSRETQLGYDAWTKIVAGNYGFMNPEDWAALAEQHWFKPVKASGIFKCPDCGTGQPYGRDGIIGQYVYYSTFHRLIRCPQCALIYADAQVDPAVLAQHFEGAYKDAGYFRQRAPIFRQLAALALRAYRPYGKILDVGGATGYLRRHIHHQQPDHPPPVVVSEISKTAVDQIRAEHGEDAACLGTLQEMARWGWQQPRVMVCSDVLYYESDVRGMWEALGKIVAPGGTLIIRVPNKLWYIRLRQWWFRHTRSWSARQVQMTMPGFNPEHRTILSRPYLIRRLAQAGFTNVRVLASPPLLPRRLSWLSGPIGALCQAVAWATGSRWIISPAMVLVATRKSA